MDADSVGRQALQAAEDDVLQHAGLLGADEPARGPRALLRPRRWRRSSAIAGSRALAWAAAYPLHTLALHAQSGGGSIRVCMSWLARGLPLGVFSLGPWRLHAVGALVGRLGPEPTTFLRTAAGALLHYFVYGLFYGLLRQSVAARLLSLRGRRAPAGPALAWVGERLQLRAGLRGAVLASYVRDVGGSLVQGALTLGFGRLLTSTRAARVYGGVVRVGAAWRRAVGWPSEQPCAGAAAEARDAARACAGIDDQLAQIHGDRQTLRRVEFLAYTQAVSAMLAGVGVRALLYPVDTVLVRLLADEAGLTARAFSGFGDCLARVYRESGVDALYAGFAPAIVSDLALVWAAAEAMHYLCKTAWIAL